MCRSVEQGGRRCSSHLQQAITKQEKAMSTNRGTWTPAELRQAQAEVDAWRTQLNRQRDAYAARKRNAALKEQRRKEERLTQLTAVKTPAVENDTATYRLTKDEHDYIAEQAQQARLTKSAYVRARLSEAPTVQPVLVADLDPSTWQTRADRQGRHPSVTSTNRVGDKVRLPYGLRQQVEAQAAGYALTSSDYIRATLTGQDPRLDFGHMSEDTRKARREHFTTLEEGQTPATIEEFYLNRFTAVEDEETEQTIAA